MKAYLYCLCPCASNQQVLAGMFQCSDRLRYNLFLCSAMSVPGQHHLDVIIKCMTATHHCIDIGTAILFILCSLMLRQRLSLGSTMQQNCDRYEKFSPDKEVVQQARQWPCSQACTHCVSQDTTLWGTPTMLSWWALVAITSQATHPM